MGDIDWGKELEDAGVLWRRGDVAASHPHGELTSGKHSDGYCNCAKIVVDPALLERVAAAMIENIMPHLDDKPDFVVGPAYGAITLAHEVARQMGTKFAFTEVEYTDAGKMQVLKRFDIPTDAKVLVVEDVVTTGGSAMKTVHVLREKNINVIPFLPIILNWSGLKMVEDMKLVPLIESKMTVQEPDVCTLCRGGSEALRPKSHWDQLVG